MASVAPTEQRLIVDRHVPCTMRDGTVLRADVYRPAEAKGPVLVHRIPYNRQTPMALTNSMFPPIIAASRGYAVVVQDTRGRFGSDGLFSPFHQEADDGYDTIEWAAVQPWSNGRVGIYGSSYMGVTSLQAVAAAPPSLGAAIAYLTGGDYHNGWVYTGGAFELLFNLRWACGAASSETHRLNLSPEEDAHIRQRLQWITHQAREAQSFTPLKDVFGPATRAIPFWEEWMSHPSYDDYWESVDLTRTLANVTVPVLSVTGWYDPFLIGLLSVWATLARGPAIGPTPDHELMIGPWDHESYQGVRNNAAGDRFFGPQAVGGAAGLAGKFLDWFDLHLKDKPTKPFDSQARVRYFHMGPDQWRTTAAWPPSPTANTFFLRTGGSANTRHGNGDLSLQPGPTDDADSFTYDPHNPVPTCGGRHLGFQYGRAGVQDQADLELRPDVLVYTGPGLTEFVDVVGAVEATLFVRSSAPSTDFTAKLVDVRPDGYCANVAEGITRVGPDHGDLTGDRPLRVTVDLWDTAYRFEAGHRIRLEVSSSNFPRFDRNGNTGSQPSLTSELDWVEATQQVWSGPTYSSMIRLGGSRVEGERLGRVSSRPYRPSAAEGTGEDGA